MSDIVNLRAARKAKARASARATADENAVKHGRTKAERDLEKAEAERASRRHAAHRREASPPEDQE